MATTSKKHIKVPNRNAAQQFDDALGVYNCTCCGKIFDKQRTYFPKSQSKLYAKNSQYLPICWTCVINLYHTYTAEFEDDYAGAERVCCKLDYYWNRDAFQSIKDSEATTDPQIKAYINKINRSVIYARKTYDDTISERGESWKQQATAQIERETALGQRNTLVEQATPEMKQFWGNGFENEDYFWLEERFKRWADEDRQDRSENAQIDIGAETIYKQICILERTIDKENAAGRATDKLISQLNQLVQTVRGKMGKAREAADGGFDGQPLGVGIRMYEFDKPIPETPPELQDQGGLIRLITIWFFGHLCKMLHIKNSYCKLYEQEIERLKIERPDLNDEDDDNLLYDIFGELEQ